MKFHMFDMSLVLPGRISAQTETCGTAAWEGDWERGGEFEEMAKKWNEEMVYGLHGYQYVYYNDIYI